VLFVAEKTCYEHILTALSNIAYPKAHWYAPSSTSQLHHHSSISVSQDFLAVSQNAGRSGDGHLRYSILWKAAPLKIPWDSYRQALIRRIQGILLLLDIGNGTHVDSPSARSFKWRKELHPRCKKHPWSESYLEWQIANDGLLCESMWSPLSGTRHL
jgi:hypothetical protein